MNQFSYEIDFFPLCWIKQESLSLSKPYQQLSALLVIGAASLSHAWCRVRFRTARSPSGWRSGAVVSAGRTRIRAHPTSPSGDRATSRPSKRSASTCGSAAMGIQASTVSQVTKLSNAFQSSGHKNYRPFYDFRDFIKFIIQIFKS